MWEDGQKASGCSAGQKDPSGKSECWYLNPDYNTTFDAYCSRSNCSCPAVEKLAMGREQHPMCHNRSRSSAGIPSRGGYGYSNGIVDSASGLGGYFKSIWGDYIEALACKTMGNWYSTQAAGLCKAGRKSGPGADCWWELVETKRTINASCADTRVIEAVQAVRVQRCPCARMLLMIIHSR